MAYGLQVWGDPPTSQDRCEVIGGTWDAATLVCSGFNPHFDSNDAFGFIEITSFSVSGSGSPSDPAVTVSGTLPNYSAVFPIYVPDELVGAAGLTRGDTRRPVVTSTFNSGTGAWEVMQTWSGTTDGAPPALSGGRVIIFAH